MATNVHCAGCGWEGERFTQPPESDWGTRGNAAAWAAAVARAMTAKPCPRCGGRVELIPIKAGT